MMLWNEVNKGSFFVQINMKHLLYGARQFTGRSESLLSVRPVRVLSLKSDLLLLSFCFYCQIIQTMQPMGSAIKCIFMLLCY